MTSLVCIPGFLLGDGKAKDRRLCEGRLAWPANRRTAALPCYVTEKEKICLKGYVRLGFGWENFDRNKIL